MENNPTGANDLPVKQIKIVDCGELKDGQKLSEENAKFLVNYKENFEGEGMFSNNDIADDIDMTDAGKIN